MDGKSRSLQGCPYLRAARALGLNSTAQDHVCDLLSELRDRGEHRLAAGLLDWARDGDEWDHEGLIDDVCDAVCDA